MQPFEELNTLHSCSIVTQTLHLCKLEHPFIVINVLIALVKIIF